ncbi:MAG: metallophosphoesterase family protein, partial [Defluviitaleaceae bacterium]|nr:metallophosphoesterase family protein [Defluviitaleaceae bacterium]
MKILVFSDSHGSSKIMGKIISENLKTPDFLHVVFLGDVCEDIMPYYDIYDNINFHIVAGNCDYDRNLPKEKILKINNKKILITHGDNFGVKSGHDRIINAALKYRVNACFFG